MLTKNNNLNNHTTININNVNNNKNTDLSVYYNQKDNNLKRNDSTEISNNHKDFNNSLVRDQSSLLINSNINCDSNKSVIEYHNIDLKNDKNIDSFICNNYNMTDNFLKNAGINQSICEHLKCEDNSSKNQPLCILNEHNIPDCKKNSIQISNEKKNDFNIKNQNNMILKEKQDFVKSDISTSEKQHKEISIPNKSSNIDIININDVNLVTKNNLNLNSDSQKLREIKRNILNSSNNVDNQEFALTQKVTINNTPKIIKDKNFNLNEQILNNTNMKLANNSNLVKKDIEVQPSSLKINQIPTNPKNIINHPINNPIINYINNSSNNNMHNIKKENQSNAFNNFDKKRYNLKKFQTSTDSN